VTTLHPNCAAVQEILVAEGLPGRVQLLSDAATTARLAADQLGCDVGAIANSLIFAADPGSGEDGPVPILVMASGAYRIDVEKVSATIGARLRRADAAFVRAHTGQPIGGVAPVGHPAPIRTVVDRNLASYPTLWTGGGIPHAVVPWTYPDLLRLTGGTEIDVV
jgi:prolyl-tRNA editing enzyme YbaK/EbsC (Cys-tRNA(Pro) deacylase)